MSVEKQLYASYIVIHLKGKEGLDLSFEINNLLRGNKQKKKDESWTKKVEILRLILFI